jgi:hypothetical protein
MSMPGVVEAAEAERRVIHEEFKNRAGDAYVKIMEALDAGQQQIVVAFRPDGVYAVNIYSSYYLRHLTCPTDLPYELEEWERVPASVIYGQETASTQ